jgi:hypothetical protein
MGKLLPSVQKALGSVSSDEKPKHDNTYTHTNTHIMFKYRIRNQKYDKNYRCIMLFHWFQFFNKERIGIWNKVFILYLFVYLVAHTERMPVESKHQYVPCE